MKESNNKITNKVAKDAKRPRLQDFGGKEKSVSSYALSYFKLILFAKAPMATPNVEADLIEEAWNHACEVNNYKKKITDEIQRVVSVKILK